MENRFFEPWVGQNYQEGIEGKKVLVLGESHYCASSSDAHPNMTKEIIADLSDPKSEHEPYKNTYTKFARALSGEQLSNASAKGQLWNSVAFYNYVQTPIDGARVSPTTTDFKNSEPAFFATLEQLKPDVAIAWGKRLYEQLPSAGEALPNIVVEGKEYRQWSYTLSDGNSTRVLEMTHPSANYSPEEWHKVIRAFLAWEG